MCPLLPALTCSASASPAEYRKFLGDDNWLVPVLVRQWLHVPASRGISTIFYVNMDLGSRGPCRVLFTPGNLDITSTGTFYLAICVRLRWCLEEFLHFLCERGACSPLSMMFTVALYLPWCRYLAAHEGVQPQVYADNLKCVSRDPDLLLNAARFTTGYVQLVGQEPAPSKCVLVLSKEEKSGLSNLMSGTWRGHLDTTFRGWSSTLAAGVGLVISRPVLIFALS